MAILSNNEHITKILDNEGNILVDLTTLNGETQIIGKQPIVFNSDGSELNDYTIYGNAGGVGDYDQTTGLYSIPITIYGKNLLENNFQSETSHGLTVTVNADKSITVNGTADTTITFALYDGSHIPTTTAQKIENGIYYLSGVPQGAETGTYTMSYRYASTSDESSQIGRIPVEGLVLDNSNGDYQYLSVYIAVWEGVTVQNVTFYPMLQLASIQNLDYEPQKTSISTTLLLDSPLTASQAISKIDSQVNIFTLNGINCLFVDTTIEPKNIRIKNKNLEFISSGNVVTYQIEYYSDDGTVLYGTESVIADKNAIGYSKIPQKASTAQYTYAFLGWSTRPNSSTIEEDVFLNITQNKKLYAVFTQNVRTYSVYFYNENNDTPLQVVTNIPYGGSATYSGNEPEKEGHTFIGWLPSPSNITGDTSCYAQFEPLIDGLITDDWATISSRSAAGTAANYYSVGDCKAVDVKGTMGTLALDTTLYVYILGFDHNISNGESRGITFGGFKTDVKGTDVALCDSNYGLTSADGSKWLNMSHWGNYNYGGWKGSDMRYDILGSTNVQPSGYGSAPTTSKVGYDATSTCATTPVANTLMSCLPSDLRSVMRPMTKYTDNKGNSSNVEANLTTSIDYLPLLSEYEVQGVRAYANQYEQNKQAQYAYYSDGNSKVKYNHSATSNSVAWWVRSPYYSSSSSFCYVYTDGDAYYSRAYSSRGVAPAFLIGGTPATYTINYYSQDGQTLLYTETVTQSEDATYSVTPTKQSTAQYNYTFAGWSDAINSTDAVPDITKNISQNLNLYAAFTETERTFTVYFYNEDTLLQTVTDVPYGGTAAYTEQTPAKTNYVFSGWSPSNTNITENTICYAQFEVEELAESISDSWEEIIANINNGTYASKYNVGDTKKIDLGTEGEIIMQVVGIDADDLADNSGKAPITWVSKQLLQTSHRMNPSYSSGTEGTGSLGGWEKTEMRRYLKETIKPLIPETVRNAIKPVKKYSRIYNVSGSPVNDVLTTEDVWIPSYKEVFGSGLETLGPTYSTTFPDNASRIKSRAGSSADWWWLRSANTSSYFYSVYTDGSNSSYYAIKTGGVALGFCT